MLATRRDTPTAVAARRHNVINIFSGAFVSKRKNGHATKRRSVVRGPRGGCAGLFAFDGM